MKISVVGVGYVGIHSVVNLSKSNEEYSVVAFDINQDKISLFNQGIDVTDEVGNKTISEINKNVKFTSNEEYLQESDVYIIAVPTDASAEGKLFIKPLEMASQTVAKHMKEGSIVVYESTVYPGLTEEICIPIIEKYSGKKVVKNFNVVYTPERVDPGNIVNTVKNTPRVISGTSHESVQVIKKIYEEYITNMVIVSTIKTAESVKILENTQRDINIAFMNNFAMLMDKMEIDFAEVLEAASTKWNFIKFHPGLVGGHCIGVDPYYLISKMNDEGVDPTFISSGRKINEDLLTYIEGKIFDFTPRNILYVGCTFKPNTNDIRNSKNIELINRLRNHFSVDVYDPIADYNNKIANVDIKKYDTIIIGVIHKEVNYDFLDKATEQKVISLVKGFSNSNINWSLV